jgi:hypothetical protein
MAAMHNATTEAISMYARFTRLMATALALAALCVALTTTAPAGTTMPKPGFMPGTWVGQGTIAGTVQKGPMTTKFDGRITFRLKVNNKFGVSGTGQWKQSMFGTQDAPAQYGVGAMIHGTAAVTFKGTATKVTFFGKQKLVTEIRAGSRKTIRHESEEQPDLNGRLTITRATHCKVDGKTEIQPRVFLTWSATLTGPCHG